MRALTLWQPWASLVALGHKKFETRSWALNAPMPLLIHAASRWSQDLSAIARAFNHHLPEGRERLPAKPPLGAIVALVEVVECIRVDQLPSPLDPLEQRFGDYGPGRFAWRLGRVTRLDEPVPCKGAQRLWYPTIDVYQRVWDEVVRKGAA